MDVDRLLLLLNLHQDSDKEGLKDYLELQLFEIKKNFQQPGFMFKKYYSKINQLEKLIQLDDYLSQHNDEVKEYQQFPWSSLINEIHTDYPTLYQDKIKWNMQLQNEKNPRHIKKMLQNYETKLIELAQSWVESFYPNQVDENHRLYEEAKLSYLGDPTGIYKSFENIPIKAFQDSQFFTKFEENESADILLKETIKAYKFLKIIHGK